MLSFQTCSIVLAAIAVEPGSEVVTPGETAAVESTSTTIADDATPPRVGPAVNVALDLSTLPEADARQLEPLLRAEVDRRLASMGATPSDEDARVRLTVRVVLRDPSALDFAVEFVLRVDDRVLAPPFGLLRCDMCLQAQIVEQFADYLPRALDVLLAAAETPPPVPKLADPPQAAPQAEPIAEPIEQETREAAHGPWPQPQPPPSHPRARWLGGLGVTGILIAAGGLGALTLGVIYINRRTERRVDPRDDSQFVVRDLERPGWILYGAGLGAVALGGVMIAIDVTALHERRRSRVAARPSVSPSHVGLALSGRF